MSRQVSPVKTCRKDFHCTACDQTIKAGSKYRYVYAKGECFSFHAECEIPDSILNGDVRTTTKTTERTNSDLEKELSGLKEQYAALEAQVKALVGEKA